MFPRQWKHLLEVEWNSPGLGLSMNDKESEKVKKKWINLRLEKSDEFIQLVNDLAKDTGFAQ